MTFGVQNIDASGWTVQIDGTRDSEFQSSLKAGPFFTDDFASGDLTKTTGGFSWGDTAYAVVGPAPPGKTTNALNFPYPAVPLGDTSTWVEQRFEMGAAYPEIYVRYDMYIPANYKHRFATSHAMTGVTGTFQVGEIVRDTPDTGIRGTIRAIVGDTLTLENLTNRYSPATGAALTGLTSGATCTGSTRTGFADNMKSLMQLWHGLYGTSFTDQYMGFENWTVNGDENDGDEISYHPVVDQGAYNPGHTVTGQLFVNPATDLASWINWTVRWKAATVANNDGIVEVWKNDTKIISVTNLPIWSSAGNNSLERGYLLGATSAGFDEATTLSITNFAISETNEWGLIPA